MTSAPRFCDCGTPVECGSYTVFYCCEMCPKMESAFYLSEEQLACPPECEFPKEEESFDFATADVDAKAWR